MEENVTTLNPSALPENKAIRAAARGELKGNWTQPVLMTLVYMIATSAAAGILGLIPIVGTVLAYLIILPVNFGFILAFLNFMRGQNRDEMIGLPYKVFQEFGRYLGTSLLQAIFIALWSLLLIIPGIIMSYAYAMVPYLCRENPELSAMDCIKKSKAMMKGYKWKLFLLDLSFIGWMLLCILTLGIGMLWLQPYMYCSRAKFYEELKAKQN